MLKCDVRPRMVALIWHSFAGSDVLLGGDSHELLHRLLRLGWRRLCGHSFLERGLPDGCVAFQRLGFDLCHR